jgi:hypothetical protein
MIAAHDLRWASAVLIIASALCARAHRTEQVPDRCRLAQLWSEGDQHFWETLEVREDGSGAWETGGFDSDAPRRHVDFEWTRTDSSFTAIRRNGTRATASFQIEPHETWCFLRFSKRLFSPSSSGSWLLGDGPPY